MPHLRRLPYGAPLDREVGDLIGKRRADEQKAFHLCPLQR